MKKVIFASLAVAMFTACSNDDVVLENNASNEIRFGVTTERNSRAADVYCNNHKFENFNLFATYGDAIFISKATVTGGASSWTPDKTYYWPTEGDVKFYGYVNGTLDVTDINSPKFTKFSPEQNVADQKDLLYAVKTQAKKTATKVDLNFRHALSQIVFNARNDNENLRVSVKGVSIVNVKGEGTYTINGANTDGNIDHEYGNGDFQTAGRGSWSFENVEANSKYAVTFTPVTVNGDKTTVNLTDWSNHTAAGATTAATAADKALAMLLLPQQTDKYIVDKEEGDVKGENDKFVRTGSYFLVDCEISYVDVDEATNEEHVTVLWDKGDVLVPVAFNWEEGKKYIYTFVFGNGNGGYDPDPDDPTPDPVLVPITFDVTIDEFFEVSGKDYEYETPENKKDETKGDEQA